MRKSAGVLKLLATTAILTMTVAVPVAADPVSAAVAVSTWLTATVGAQMAAAIIQVGLSLIVSGGLALAIGGQKETQSQEDLIRELQQPTSLPVYRFVYGSTWAPGTPAPVRTRRGMLVGCYLLNSRPSAGPFTVYLDKREVEYTGDPYNFAGSGAIATNGPFSDHCSYWIGRGDQTSPPAALVAEFPEFFQSTDAWQGRTVLWVRLRIGEEEDRAKRWPAAPPEVMVNGRWSLVSDPRNPSAPAAYSANQALCTLDAIRNNPLRKYDNRNLWLETFEWSADVADEAFPVKGGGTIPKFEVNGVLAFREGTEVEDQIIPLADAGASRLIRVSGRLGLLPAVYSEPVKTITGFLGDAPAVFTRYRPTSELVTEVSSKYVSPQRMYEDAETPPYTLPGAQAMDGGDVKKAQFNLKLVTDHRQAQYVTAIMGRRMRMQKSFAGVLPASAFDLVSGSTVTLDFPAPFALRNGIYEVEKIDPGGDLMGLDGFAMRCHTTMRETSPAIYAWNPATDEQDVPIEDFDPEISGVATPGAIAVTSDNSTTLRSGDTVIPRVMFQFNPAVSDTVVSYQWEYKTGTGTYQEGGSIDKNVRNSSSKVFGFVSPAVIGQSYRVRVRTVTYSGKSLWVESSVIFASSGPSLTPAPTPVSALGGSGEISVTFRAPNDGDYRYMEIWASNTNVIGTATLRFGPEYGAANTTVTKIETGLGTPQTRYYWARSFDRNGQPSGFSGSISATT